jgi:hypothetical protein
VVPGPPLSFRAATIADSAAGQARGRQFYEREGWVLSRDEFHDPVPDLVLVEYRRELVA